MQQEAARAARRPDCVVLQLIPFPGEGPPRGAPSRRLDLHPQISGWPVAVAEGQDLCVSLSFVFCFPFLSLLLYTLNLKSPSHSAGQPQETSTAVSLKYTQPFLPPTTTAFHPIWTNTTEKCQDINI